MRIIITGGTGFIGSNLFELLNNDHEVKIFDINPLSLIKNEYQFCDVTNYSQTINLAKNCDVIVHLAASVGVERTDKNPVETLDVNIQGTKNILESCRINDIGKIILASSSEVYGEPISLPIKESDRLNPITTYGVSKVTAEEYAKGFAKTYGIKYTILRFFNVYGYQQSEEFVISNFIKLALNNKPISIHGDGTQVRAFCNVGDVVKGTSLVLNKGDNNIFNIGNDLEPVSIKELAEQIISITDSKNSKILIPFEKSNRDRNEILHRIPNIEKAKKLLGYKPEISLKQGIQRIIESMKNEI